MNRGKATRDDVAREAGTSVAVVSYVVNNGPRAVAEATRQRVLDAIEQLGYRPDRIARALASGSTRTYGLIVPNVANPFVAALTHAIEDEAFRRGLSLLLGDSADDVAREAELVNTFLQHQIDGLLFYGVDHHHPWLDAAAEKVPVVLLDERTADSTTASVRVDELEASAAATRHLIEHGYRTIATITGPLDQQNARDRVAGWRRALTLSSLPARSELLFETSYTRHGGYEAAGRLLDAAELPEAVFVANEQQAIGFLTAAHERGIRIPDHLAVICLNGTSNAEYTIPPLSTVEQPLLEIAEHALGLLAEPLPAGRNAIECAFALVPRRSCGCAYTRKVAREAETPRIRALA